MMGRTHLAIGLATSLAVIRPGSLQECAVAVVGGAVGGVLADNDILDNDYHADALIGQLLAIGLVAITILFDYFFNLGICNTVCRQPLLPILGGVSFAVLYLIGFFSEHRTFTHSFLALALYSISAWLVYRPLVYSVSAAYLSHILLDVLNKKTVPILYPLDFGICLKLCYANRTANKVFMYGGFAVSGVLLTIGLISSFM